MAAKVSVCLVYVNEDCVEVVYMKKMVVELLVVVGAVLVCCVLCIVCEREMSLDVGIGFVGLEGIMGHEEEG